jgi:hypothetical protein
MKKKCKCKSKCRCSKKRTVRKVKISRKKLRKLAAGLYDAAEAFEFGEGRLR